MADEKVKRTFEQTRDELKVAKAKRVESRAKIAAYDEAYKAAAVARREKAAAEGQAKA
jgi:hypothetical protein